jgi:anti-sigma-K factor RskA
MTAPCEHGIDAGAYVLHALEDEEHARFADHLGTCPTCRREVQQLQIVVDHLPMSAPQELPAAALKDRIMSTVEAEAELLHAAGPDADRVAARPRPRRWPAWLSLRPVTAATAAAGILAVGVLGGIVLAGRDDGRSPVVRTIAGSAAVPGARVALTVSDGHGELHLRGIPNAASGRVYQVWLQRGAGAPRPTHTLFDVRSDGRATVRIAEPVTGMDRVLVTAEPEGGSRVPSGAPLISASTS